MPYDYTSTTDVKSLIPDSQLSSTTDTSYDTALGILITAASRLIDRAVGRWPGYFKAVDTDNEESRFFDGPSSDSSTSSEPFVWIDPMCSLPSAVSIAESGNPSSLTALSTDDWYPYPYNWSEMAHPITALVLDVNNGDYYNWPHYRKSVKVTGHFGYALGNPPTDIRTACVMQVIRWFKRLQQNMQTVGAIPELGTLVYSQLDPDIAETLRHYIVELE